MPGDQAGALRERRAMGDECECGRSNRDGVIGRATPVRPKEKRMSRMPSIVLFALLMLSLSSCKSSKTGDSYAPGEPTFRVTGA